jgi:hypothetical protein
LFPQIEKNSKAARGCVRNGVSKNFAASGTIAILAHLITN